MPLWGGAEMFIRTLWDHPYFKSFLNFAGDFAASCEVSFGDLGIRDNHLPICVYLQRSVYCKLCNEFRIIRGCFESKQGPFEHRQCSGQWCKWWQEWSIHLGSCPVQTRSRPSLMGSALQFRTISK
jgi:hypothetical protein